MLHNAMHQALVCMLLKKKRKCLCTCLFTRLQNHWAVAKKLPRAQAKLELPTKLCTNAGYHGRLKILCTLQSQYSMCHCLCNSIPDTISIVHAFHCKTEWHCVDVSSSLSTPKSHIVSVKCGPVLALRAKRSDWDTCVVNITRGSIL